MLFRSQKKAQYDRFGHAPTGAWLCRLSIRLSWPFTQLGGSDATKHTRKAKGFHAAGELIRLSAHLSLHFAFPVDSPVVDCLKLFRLSARLSRMLLRLW